jgi:lipopolysaccharide transport system ATP-binding protein
VRGKEDPYALIGQTNDRSQKAESDYVWALKDINFEAEQGEILGIIGRNGAGKSTLLKILSQITSPTTGTIKTKGRIASLLEVGTGMHPEMTARENIYLNGAILGMTKKEIAAKFDEIVDFSGCAMYVDTPLKRFSSGMRVRLGFAVAAFLEPEILIVDEVLAVGDAEFQKKAIGKMKDISSGGGRTVLFVSHNMASIRSLCTRALVMNNGTVTFVGSVHEATQFYLAKDSETELLALREDRVGGEIFRYSKVRVLNEKDEEVSELISGLHYKVEIYYQSKSSIEPSNFHWGISLLNKVDELVFGFSSIESGIRVGVSQGEGKITWEIPRLNLRGGHYALRLFASKNSTTQSDIIDLIENAHSIAVHPGDFWSTGTINRQAEEVLIPGRLY